ncbi:nucleic-acid-binding protein [Clostridium aceticum]|uniref:Nucleic-acid-binding protein n=1 Tax=Clostridium aceticum TaxID=84022 RepID=A0A0D8I6M1_9CLOT|nr:YlxR family protein [Clostridium aceticum]AKL95435.1 nucleic-acid-binding protein [Clostridium aceticum]KJF25925.1 nucleic-acid-binding protein implicated in transcription termination [Clostridium aceticum]
MKVRKIPLRKCIGCNEMKGKKELIRIVCNKQGEINVDLTGKAHGRGAYICNNKPCFEKIKKSKALNRAFQSEVPQEVYERLVKEISDSEE